MDDYALTGEMQRARQFVAERRWLHAVQVYRKILDAHPDHDEVWVELAHAYAAMNRIDAAESLLLERSRASASPEPYLFLLGSLMYRSGKVQEAHKHLVRVLRSEKKLDTQLRARLHFLLGAIFADGHKWSVAEFHFRTVLRLDPSYPRIHESLAEVLLRRSKLHDAHEHVKLALYEEPYSWTGHFLLGSVLGKKKEWEEALAAFTMCVDIDTNEPRGWLKCGEAMLHMKRLEESERYLRKALELNPMMTDAIVEFGYLSLERGDLQGAEECFEKVLSVEPTNRKALAGSRVLHKKTGGVRR